MKFLILISLLTMPVVSNAATVTPEQCAAIGKAYIMPTFTVKGYRRGHCRKMKQYNFRSKSQDWLIKEEKKCDGKTTNRCNAVRAESELAN